jgi:hypothetical protein
MVLVHAKLRLSSLSVSVVQKFGVTGAGATARRNNSEITNMYVNM